MMFWGASNDPSKATKYEILATDDDSLPSQEPLPTTTKVLTKPTAHLPGDHGEAEGENTNPAFSTIQPSTVPTGTSSPAIPSPEEVGWFPNMSNLVSNQKWFFVALGAVALFGIGAAVFFWRRRRARLVNYTTLPAGDDVSMNALAGGERSAPRHASRPTKELYDAFGEVSDDEYDGDEGEKLLRGAQISTGLGFHSGFLKDDVPRVDETGRYRDHPEESHKRGTVSPVASPSGSGGSWEHAS